MELADMPLEKLAAGAQPLASDEAADLGGSIPEWLVGETAIERRLKFHGFVEAIAFVNRVAGLAEQVQHHPDICISYNRVRLELSTHQIGGLSVNDFIVAARIERLVDH